MTETKPKTPTDTLLSHARREAKRATTETFKYTAALDAQAVMVGYADWRTLTMANVAYKRTKSPVLDAIPLNPDLPENFDNTPNEDRSTAELDQWWEKPFVESRREGRFDVRCLDGGAWDRSTWYGTADTLDEARALALKKLAEWRDISQQPVRSLRDDGLWDLVHFGGRPDSVTITTVLVAGLKDEEVLDAMEKLKGASN